MIKLLNPRTFIKAIRLGAIVFRYAANELVSFSDKDLSPILIPSHLNVDPEK